MPETLKPCKSMYAVAWKHYTRSSRTMVKLVKVDRASEIERIKAELARIGYNTDDKIV